MSCSIKKPALLGLPLNIATDNNVVSSGLYCALRTRYRFAVANRQRTKAIASDLGNNPIKWNVFRITILGRTKLFSNEILFRIACKLIEDRFPSRVSILSIYWSVVWESSVKNIFPFAALVFFQPYNVYSSHVTNLMSNIELYDNVKFSKKIFYKWRIATI